MGSHPTLDQTEPAAEALEPDPDDWSHGHAVAHLAADHPQVRAWPDGNPDLAHDLDHRHWIHDHHHRMTERTAEHSDRIGHHDIQRREHALALGVRVAVHDSRQNDPKPVIWQPGQDYRMAEAIQAARTQPTRTRHGPERVGLER